MTSAERHARLLLRWYPRVWRERYGEEFSELLVDDLTECPRSLRRDVDVVRAGLCARLAAYGLAPGPLQDRAMVRFVMAGASAVFVAAALSIWTQLADGWLTARPETALVGIGLVSLSVSLGGLVIAALAVGVRFAVAVARTVRAGHGIEILRPMSLLVTSGGVLVAGVQLMAPLWPGATASQHDGVLAFTARIGWALTDPISTYWLHPHRLLILPAGELAWMVVCPAAVVAFAWAAVRLVRVCALRLPRTGGRASFIGGIAVLPGLVTAAAWVVGSQHAADATYRAGTLDLVLIAAMLTAALVTRNALIADAARPDG